MTARSLMDGQDGRPGNGPASVTATSGGWLIGTQISVTGQVMWLYAYRLWVPADGDTTPRAFALWNTTTTTTQVLVPGSGVTSGTLQPGAWNEVPLAAPLQLAPGTQYVPAAGWDVTAGIAVTSGQFDTGDPYEAGITNGPLTAWSAGTGTNPYPVTGAAAGIGGQQVFSNTSGADPAAAMPANGSGSDNLWIDIVADDTPPAGYAGSWRLWPNRYELGNWNLDTASNFTLGQQFTVTELCQVSRIWFYSPAGAAQLPTGAGVLDAAGNVIGQNTAPAWQLPGGGAAAAGGGWMSAACPGTVTPGTVYWACVVNGAASPQVWNAAAAAYWSTGFGAAGLTAGPLSAPGSAAAAPPGQNSYHAGAALHLPDTSAGPYSYGVDIEVIPAAAAAGSVIPAALLTGML